MMFWSVGPFWYMVYGIWYVAYGMKMAFIVYLHMFRVRRAWAAYNVVHLFLVYVRIRDKSNKKIFHRSGKELSAHLIYIVIYLALH